MTKHCLHCRELRTAITSSNARSLPIKHGAIHCLLICSTKCTAPTNPITTF
jgi:hypothetical protein